MTTSHVLTALVALMFAGGGASASTLSTPTLTVRGQSPAKAYMDAHDHNKVICKTTEVTGSRLGGEKVCRKRAEWDDIAHEDSSVLNGLTRTRSMAAPTGR